MMVAATGLLVLALILLVLTLGVFALVVSRRPKVMRPSCGRCEYDVTGLEELRCPECGSDLREVGILTAAIGRGPRPRTVTTLTALVWTLLLAMLASIVSPILGRTLPQSSVNDATVVLSTRAGASLGGGVVLEIVGTGPRTAFADEVTVRLPDAAGARSRGLRIDLPDRTHRIEQADGSFSAGAGAIDVETLAAWLRATGADPDSDDLVAAARDLLTIVGNFERKGHVLVQGGYFTGASMTSTTTVLPRPWLVPTVVAGWLVVWVTGLGLIVRKARRSHAVLESEST